jgi:transcriptional regulator with XRE-family HTH domain
MEGRLVSDPDSAGPVDVAGLLRRIRRTADLSQRELAARLRVSKTAVAAFESGTRTIDVHLLAAAAALAGLRIALLDEAGAEVRGMRPDCVRDRGGRRFPAHLDTVLSEERASRWEHRPHLRQPTYTFDRRDPWADAESRAQSRPDDHLVPQPGDSPADRAAARRREARDQRLDELARRREAGELPPVEPFTCTCPPSCDELDDWSGRPVHHEQCPCSCDVG